VRRHPCFIDVSRLMTAFYEQLNRGTERVCWRRKRAKEAPGSLHECTCLLGSIWTTLELTSIETRKKKDVGADATGRRLVGARNLRMLRPYSYSFPLSILGSNRLRKQKVIQ
jgi:hypothetical protein